MWFIFRRSSRYHQVKSATLHSDNDKLNEKRKTMAMYKKYSKLFPLNTLQIAAQPQRVCHSRIDNQSSLLGPSSSKKSTRKLNFNISVMKAESDGRNDNNRSWQPRNDYRSISSRSEESALDPTIMITSDKYMRYPSVMSNKSVIPHCSEVGQTDSVERVSNCSYSSTYSKVSVNSKFMEVVRFSLKSNLNRYTKIYNKYNHVSETKAIKRRSKSLHNLWQFSSNLCKIMKRKGRKGKPKLSRGKENQITS